MPDGEYGDMVCYKTDSKTEVATDSSTPLYGVLSELKQDWGYEALTSDQMPEGTNTDITLPTKGSLQERMYELRNNVMTPDVEVFE